MKTIFTKPSVALAIGLLWAVNGYTQEPTPLQIELEVFASGLNKPVGIYHCGDDRLFVVEQDQGDIEILNTSGDYLGKFLDLTGLIQTGGERGLLGLAFHPNYTENGYFYVNYYSTSAQTVIARYSVSDDNPDLADASSAQILMTINQPYGNHNGGHIEFGPDGYLYIGMGDGGSAGDPQNYSQNNQSLLGKMLRIDVDADFPYAVPADNPFVGNPGVLDEIWATGVRNPWKFSFDRATGDMWMGDVGQNAWEEINFQPADSPGGENYGWRCYEGPATYNTSGCAAASNYVFPAVSVANNNQTNYCSITGGMVYRGDQYPFMNGYYLFTDYCAGDIRATLHDGEGNFETHQALPNQGFGFVAFGDDYLGELYLVKINSGQIFKVKDACGDFNPEITLDETTFTASEGDNFWWYLDDSIIPGANEQTFQPTTDGNYYAVVGFNGTCARMSNTIFFGCEGPEGCTEPNACNYDPDALCNDDSCFFVNGYEITGETEVEPGTQSVYTYEENDGGTLTWSVTGGEIVSGQGTNTITVQWGDEPSGDAQVSVQENVDDCDGPAINLNVSIVTGVNEFESKGVRVYPNPVGDVLFIEPGNLNGAFIIELYDLTGRMVETQRLTDRTQLNVSHLAPGQYVLRITDGRQSMAGNVLIQR